MAVEGGAKVIQAMSVAADKYADSIKVRALVQLVPYIGGPLDTLISGAASKRQMQRIEHFVKELHERLRRVEGVRADVDDEAFMDLMLSTFEKVAKTRSLEKRSRFAAVVSNQVSSNKEWEDAEYAVRLLADLEDIHIRIIEAVSQVQPCEGPFGTLRVVTLEERPLGNETGNGPARLADILPGQTPLALRMATAELVARGLLHDEGIGRLDVRAMQYFVLTDLGFWLLDWIRTGP